MSDRSRLRSNTAGRVARSFAGALMLAALAGCASGPTPYQAAGDGGYGFGDQQIESNRFRVTFDGNYQTPLATVQNYLLFHAAEVAKLTHNDYFIDVSQHTDTSTDYQTNYFGGPGLGWGGGWGWHGGFGGFGGVAVADTRAKSRYTVLMDIQVFHGTKPADNPRAYDAQDVIDRLGPLVKRPVAAS